MERFDNIARMIKKKRLENNLSQSELSALCGYNTGQFISNIERSLCSIPIKKLPIIIDKLKIDEAELKDALIKDYLKNIENNILKGVVNEYAKFE